MDNFRIVNGRQISVRCIFPTAVYAVANDYQFTTQTEINLAIFLAKFLPHQEYSDFFV
jgi:hypothetical protein